MSNTSKSTVEKLIAYRDAYESENGPNEGLDNLVVFELNKLLAAHANPIVDWCNEQLENERRRTELDPVRLVPSSILGLLNSHVSPFVPPNGGKSRTNKHKKGKKGNKSNKSKKSNKSNKSKKH
jgi:hypothetical protein